MTDRKQQVREVLAEENAVEGESTFLSSHELGQRTDVPTDEIDDVLQSLRFDDELVVKGPNDQWQLREDSVLGVDDD